MPRVSTALLFASVALAPLSARAQHTYSQPAATYDPRIPTPRALLGYNIGDRFTPHRAMMRYIERIAAVSKRVKVDTVARTFEGREMLLMTVASEANMARLSQIRADANRIADPRGAPAAELAAVVRRLPSIVWLAHSVHGGEASGVEAGLALLYQLAAGTDAETQMALDSTVVLIDPNENPDGRERFTHDLERNWSAQGVASEPGALNNSGSWPGPRTSHYYFDLNRDWFIQSHPESRGRVRSFLQWWPHVAVDLHGWSYFRREGYDSFYPGYGEGWPMLTGSIGMLFESASSAGGSVRRNDGLARTLRQAAWEHYTAEWTTVRTSAGRRAELVKDYAQSRLDAIAIHSRGPMRVIAFERDAQGRADSLVVKLQANGIDVQRLTNDADFKDATPYGASAAAGATQLPAGSYVVDLAQPQGHLAKALLEPNAELDSAFLNFELELRRTGQRNRFYDVTAWSLPMAYRLQSWWSKNVPAGLAPVGELAREATPPIMRAQYAYSFEPGSESSVRLLASLLTAGEAVIPFASEGRVRLCGYFWPEMPGKLALSPYLWTERVGRGRVIAFAHDPVYRDLYRGLLPVFANAVLLGGTF